MIKQIIKDDSKLKEVCKPCKSVEEGEKIGAKLLNELTESQGGIGLAANQMDIPFEKGL